MPVYQPRTRLVNFRLSEDEYQLLKITCFRSGARSVSDYARTAILTGGGPTLPANEALNQPQLNQPQLNQPQACSARWERLEGSVHQLEAKLTELILNDAVSVHG